MEGPGISVENRLDRRKLAAAIRAIFHIILNQTKKTVSPESSHTKQIKSTQRNSSDFILSHSEIKWYVN